MGKKRGPRHETLDEVLLSKLCHESSSIDPAAVDAKIRRSLKYYGYDVDEGMRRVPRLREFKNRLLTELRRPADSTYDVRSPKKTGFAAMEDFDLTRLHDDMAEAFPSVDHALVGGFVSQVIYIYYLR